MQNCWRKTITAICLFVCLGVFWIGATMDSREGSLPEEQNLQVRILEDCGIYELGFFQEDSSGGTMNADGSPMKKGQDFVWEVGPGERTVTVTALNGSKRVIHETTVTFDFSRGTCVLLLTGEGFVPYEA